MQHILSCPRTLGRLPKKAAIDCVSTLRLCRRAASMRGSVPWEICTPVLCLQVRAAELYIFEVIQGMSVRSYLKKLS